MDDDVGINLSPLSNVFSLDIMFGINSQIVLARGGGRDLDSKTNCGKPVGCICCEAS